MTQADAAFDAIAGSITVTGRRWWHRRRTVITLNAKQVEHLKQGALHTRRFDQPSRAEIGGINFNMTHCDTPRVEILLYQDPVVDGFKPRLVRVTSGCSVCGAV